MSDPNNPTAEFDAGAFLALAPHRPGIYQMFDKEKKLLYIGKANSLKNRLSSYFRSQQLPVKTRALVARIASIEMTVTNSETEALLLEQNLIKNYRPPYNILLRDDKSYPYIFISDKHNYPAIQFHRGAKKAQGRYFGPFTSGPAVRASLNLLQKIFLVRQCDDSFYSHRSRPCLQHQIKRCSAPCVGLISEQAYAEDIRHATMFLEGKNQQVMEELASQMEAAAAELNFEKAAQLRDQLANLQKVQEQQYIFSDGGDADIFGCAIGSGIASIHMLFVRKGRMIGSNAYQPRLSLEEDAAELLTAFIAQWYLGSQREIPDQIITPFEIPEQPLLQETLSQQREKKISISHKVRTERAGWQRMAQENAEQQLSRLQANKQTLHARFSSLQSILQLETAPERLECFDISHSSGEATVASCVVFNREGAKKSDYRRFNIDGIIAGDDYAAMNQALTRRFTRGKKGEGQLPDILLIDGGKGQVTQAIEVLNSLELTEIKVVGVAKGPTRKAGFEVLILADTGKEITLASDTPALHLIQQIRDESHRFAITGHRGRRDKQRKRSALEDIAGIGAKRRKALLNHFGSVREIQNASIEEISKVSTISRLLAETIYAAFHPDA